MQVTIGVVIQPRIEKELVDRQRLMNYDKEQKMQRKEFTYVRNILIIVTNYEKL